MAAVLSISFDELEQIARELEQIALESKKLNNRTNDIICKISSSWTGDMMEEYANKITSSCHYEEQRIALLQQLSEYIRQAVKEYARADSSLAKSIKELFES